MAWGWVRIHPHAMASEKRGEMFPWGARSRQWVAFNLGILAIFSVSGCSTLEASAEKYPRNMVKDSSYLAQMWVDADSALRLNDDGAFVAKTLYADYFECASGKDEVSRSGRGTWTSRESQGTSAVFLTFSDNCTATFWLGEWEGDAVLWTDFEIGGSVVKLRMK